MRFPCSLAYHVRDHSPLRSLIQLAAEMLIMGLQRGDLDWRDIVNPKTKPFTT